MQGVEAGINKRGGEGGRHLVDRMHVCCLHVDVALEERMLGEGEDIDGKEFEGFGEDELTGRGSGCAVLAIRCEDVDAFVHERCTHG